LKQGISPAVAVVVILIVVIVVGVVGYFVFMKPKAGTGGEITDEMKAEMQSKMPGPPGAAPAGGAPTKTEPTSP
jgi:hypothetical protein